MTDDKKSNDLNEALKSATLLKNVYRQIDDSYVEQTPFLDIAQKLGTTFHHLSVDEIRREADTALSDQYISSYSVELRYADILHYIALDRALRKTPLQYTNTNLSRKDIIEAADNILNYMVDHKADELTAAQVLARDIGKTREQGQGGVGGL